jgi:lysozyme
MNETLLKTELIRFEGLKYAVYADSVGLNTVGIGHRCDLPVGTQVDLSQVQQWYQDDVASALQIARKVYTNFSQFDDTRQRLITQLCFNLGNNILQFMKMNAAIKQLDWETAAAELVSSKWYKQVGSEPGQRGFETVNAMRTGRYSFESQL